MAKPTEAAFKADLALEAQPASSRTSTKGNAVEHPPTVPEAMEYDYSNFYFGAGTDPFAIFKPFDDWWREVQPSAYYLFELPLHSAPGTRVDVRDTKTGDLRRGLVNFASYNYLGLSCQPEVKERWTPKFGQLVKVESRRRKRSLECHERDGVILLS